MVVHMYVVRGGEGGGIPCAQAVTPLHARKMFVLVASAHPAGSRKSRKQSSSQLASAPFSAPLLEDREADMRSTTLHECMRVTTTLHARICEVPGRHLVSEV